MKRSGDELMVSAIQLLFVTVLVLAFLATMEIIP
jgi:hypothetical protein